MSECFDPRECRVALLAGGKSGEREISLASGEGASQALKEAGFNVTVLDPAEKEDLKRLIDEPFDVAFLCLHGKLGEDGTVQGMMDLMGLAYTHSGLATSVIAIDKELTKQALVPHGVPMPGGRIVDSESLYERDPLARPYVLKPVNEGSSVGVAIITEGGNYGHPISRDTAGPWQEFPRLLAEPYIRGRELTTAVIDGPAGPRALGVTELVPKSGFYDFDAKYTEGMTEHVCPAQIPPAIAGLCEKYAVDAHRLLGCRGASRTDFRWDYEQGEAGLFVLETNTQPGMTPLSLVPEQARQQMLQPPVEQFPPKYQAMIEEDFRRLSGGRGKDER